MKITSYLLFLVSLLFSVGIFYPANSRAQSSDTIPTINFPLSHEDLSLYDFAEVRMESAKTEIPPVDITKRKFQPAKQVFKKDDFRIADSVKSVWIKFEVLNNQSSDTSVTLIFPGVSKAVLYKVEGDRLIQLGKTGFFIAVVARTLPYQHYDRRIDILLKANSKTEYFIQAILYNGIYLSKMPLLENFNYAEMKAYAFEKETNRPSLLWSHFLTGIFFMFFVFGFIKYLVFGKDKSYLYYSLMGLGNALLTVSLSEYPPLELPAFENIRSVELSPVVSGIAFIMQVLFILEILQLKTKYPRITRGIKGFIFAWLLVTIIRRIEFFEKRGSTPFLDRLDLYAAFLLAFLMLVWVVYVARMAKGFYLFIFMGVLTIVMTFIFVFVITFFDLQRLLPAWLGVNWGQRLTHMALVVDMCFYFTGLAYRDRQVERDKITYQEQLIKQMEA
ncbi:MAG: 7TM diverse intracellular signaling domain-containing protein, partial [Ginsengibacter sp.]